MRLLLFTGLFRGLAIKSYTLTELTFLCHLSFLKWPQAKVTGVSLKTENEESSGMTMQIRGGKAGGALHL
jgi:hypothetical protein